VGATLRRPACDAKTPRIDIAKIEKLCGVKAIEQFVQ
jgi:hypothetical protein